MYVITLRFDVDGKFLISGAEDGQVFVLDGRGTKDFAGIGYTGNAIIKPSCLKARLRLV